ncbi:HAMP domain-containing sensor histidine kinase [Psychroflexus planctonicus]|uniref:HAMP domain-containing sensor histidine kinase n=1 Tax=Psychroflexus planctonicus TaxID=1526575 RepID=UPI00166D0106|nr:ATP-binding protein [Psychroflexus planctonicus]
MTIKKKLILLLSVLFLVIISSIGLSGYYVNRLVQNSEEIVKDNYRTLLYIEQMQEDLDEIIFNINNKNKTLEALQDYESVLKKQEANITENGEATLTEQLRVGYTKIKAHLEESNADANLIFKDIYSTKKYLNKIFNLNQIAVKDRNERAKKAADDAVLYSSLFALTAILVTLFYIFKIPEYLVKPIKGISKQFQEISERNYNVSLDESRNDEFKEMALSFNKMTKRLQKFEQSNLAQLMIERNRLNAVVEQFDIPILGFSEKNQILFANDRMLEVLQVKKENIIGKNINEIVSNNDLLNLLLNQENSNNERQLLRIIVENKERLFSKRIMTTDTEISNSDSLAHDSIIILDDVTDFIQKDVRKTQFMATLSHELKTPVAAIEMSTDLLTSIKVGKLNDEQKEYVDKINDQTRHIRRMINEVLDLSKIESGIIDFELENTEVNLLIEEALQTVQPFLKNKNIRISTEIQEQLPIVKVDNHKVLWTINNFLTNAIRYTPDKGKIDLSASLKDGEIHIEVTDHGQGIDKENQKRIFEKYVRLNKNEKGGTGLGLAISKEFIEAMDGKIGVHSEIGKGSTFWIKLKTNITS